jgi:hypothetical protein
MREAIKRDRVQVVFGLGRRFWESNRVRSCPAEKCRNAEMESVATDHTKWSQFVD